MFEMSRRQTATLCHEKSLRPASLSALRVGGNADHAPSVPGSREEGRVPAATTPGSWTLPAHSQCSLRSKNGKYPSNSPECMKLSWLPHHNCPLACIKRATEGERPTTRSACQPIRRPAHEGPWTTPRTFQESGIPPLPEGEQATPEHRNGRHHPGENRNSQHEAGGEHQNRPATRPAASTTKGKRGHQASGEHHHQRRKANGERPEPESVPRGGFRGVVPPDQHRGPPGSGSEQHESSRGRGGI